MGLNLILYNIWFKRYLNHSPEAYQNPILENVAIIKTPNQETEKTSLKILHIAITKIKTEDKL